MFPQADNRLRMSNFHEGHFFQCSLHMEPRWIMRKTNQPINTNREKKQRPPEPFPEKRTGQNQGIFLSWGHRGISDTTIYGYKKYSDSFIFLILNHHNRYKQHKHHILPINLPALHSDCTYRISKNANSDSSPDRYSPSLSTQLCSHKMVSVTVIDGP